MAWGTLDETTVDQEATTPMTETPPDPLAQITDAAQRIDGDLAQIVAAAGAARAERAAQAGILAGVREQLTAATARVRELEAQLHPTPARLPFGIGINDRPATPGVHTLATLEADAGVKFAYVHSYFRFPTSGIATDVVSWCEKHLAAGRTPIPTVKMPGDDWAGAAAGKYDAVIRGTVDALEALAVKYGARVQLGIQNEPDNDGKPYAAFDAMVDHLSPIIRRPGRVEFWVNMTGWEQLYGGDTQWDLEDLDTTGIDGVAFDPYLSLGASVQNRMTDMVTAYAVPYGKWAAERGIQWAVWETGMGEVAAAMTKFPGVQTQIIDFSNGCAEHGATAYVYWNDRKNATATDWRISDTAPAQKRGQLLTAMRKWARR